MTQRPSVGRVVHYVSHGTPVLENGTQRFPSVCRAAIITEVNGEAEGFQFPGGLVVGLCVLNPTGQFFHALAAGGCAYDETDHAGGTWHWPEYVPGLNDTLPGDTILSRVPDPVRTPDQEPLT